MVVKWAAIKKYLKIMLIVWPKFGRLSEWQTFVEHLANGLSNPYHTLKPMLSL